MIGDAVPANKMLTWVLVSLIAVEATAPGFGSAAFPPFPPVSSPGIQDGKSFVIAGEGSCGSASCGAAIDARALLPTWLHLTCIELDQFGHAGAELEEFVGHPARFARLALLAAPLFFLFWRHAGSRLLLREVVSEPVLLNLAFCADLG